VTVPDASPIAPKLLKAALVTYEALDATPRVLAFQYNPQKLTRRLDAKAAGEGASRTEVQRLVGAPVETYQLEAILDATDALEEADADATANGLHAVIAALEELVYPKSDDVVANVSALDQGKIEIAPLEGRFTLFVWGKQRVLPVQIDELSVTEDAFDVNLNPIRATVSLTLRVLTYDDLPSSHPGHALFLAHQVAKEALAATATTGSFAGVLPGTTRLF
jgi:hypothetical protein